MLQQIGSYTKDAEALLESLSTRVPLLEEGEGSLATRLLQYFLQQEEEVTVEQLWRAFPYEGEEELLGVVAVLQELGVLVSNSEDLEEGAGLKLDLEQLNAVRHLPELLKALNELHQHRQLLHELLRR